MFSNAMFFLYETRIIFILLLLTIDYAHAHARLLHVIDHEMLDTYQPVRNPPNPVDFSLSVPYWSCPSDYIGILALDKFIGAGADADHVNKGGVVSSCSTLSYFRYLFHAQSPVF